MSRFTLAKRQRNLTAKLPTILLVEDEPLIRTSISIALEEAGYGLLESDNGATAIAAIDDNDALRGIITDIRLGSGPNGWEVARHARHRFPKLAVVYMTGDSAADWAAEGVPNSVLVQKPFAFGQVVTAVLSLLNIADVSPTQASPADH